MPRSRRDIEAWVKKHGTVKANTAEWFECRRGRITASSRAYRLASDDIREWRDLATELEIELEPDYQREDVQSHAFAWGHKYEPIALDEIRSVLGVAVVEPGFVLHSRYDVVGATPDGYIGDDTTIQVKCLNRNEHLTCVYTDTIQHKYYHQMQWEAWTSGRQRILYAAFHPQIKGQQGLHLIEVPVDVDMHAKFDCNLRRFRLYFDRIEQWPVPARQVAADGGIPRQSLFT